MHLLEKIKATGYIWPGKDVAAAIFAVESHHALLPLVAAYFQALAQQYGRAAVKLTFAIFDREATFAQLEAVRRNQAALLARQREARNLLPLFGPALAFDRVAPNLAVYKNRALENGLLPAGWKYLVHQSRAVIRQLVSSRFTRATFAWVNLLAQTHETLPPALADTGCFRGLQGLNDVVQGALTAPEAYHAAIVQLAGFMRITLREVRQAADAEARDQLYLEYDALAIELERTFRSQESMVFAKSTWKSLLRGMRERMAAREEAARIAAEAARGEYADTWHSAVDAQTLDGIHIKPLCSHAELVEEGVVLSHCVGNGGYTALCAQGESRIFSLKGSLSAQRATLEISRTAKGWVVGQLRSFGNSAPPAGFTRVARLICEQYDAADKYAA